MNLITVKTILNATFNFEFKLMIRKTRARFAISLPGQPARQIPVWPFQISILQMNSICGEISEFWFDMFRIGIKLKWLLLAGIGWKGSRWAEQFSGEEGRARPAPPPHSATPILFMTKCCKMHAKAIRCCCKFGSNSNFQFLKEQNCVWLEQRGDAAVAFVSGHDPL